MLPWASAVTPRSGSRTRSKKSSTWRAWPRTPLYASTSARVLDARRRRRFNEGSVVAEVIGWLIVHPAAAADQPMSLPALAAVCRDELWALERRPIELIIDCRLNTGDGPTMRIDAVHQPHGRDAEWLESSAPRNFWNQPLPARRHYKSTAAV